MFVFKGDSVQYYYKQPGEIRTYIILFQHKGLEVEVETIRLRLEPIAEEPKVGAVEGLHVDQFLAEMKRVKELVEVVIVRMVMEEREEDAALPVDEAGPEDGEVRKGVRYGHEL